MKFPLFFLFALCLSKAAAFGLYGCYERLMYWQAYQMDSGSKKQLIAKGCAKSPQVADNVGLVRGGRCNLRQFLYYIAENDLEKPTIADGDKVKDSDLEKARTDVDYVASKLHKAGVGATYKPHLIYHGMKPGTSSIDNLIRNVAGYIAQKGDLKKEDGRPNQELFDLAEKTRSRALFGRKATAARDIGNEIRKTYDSAVWDKQPKNKNNKLAKEPPMVEEGLVKEKMAIPDGGVQGWVTCSLGAAKELVNEKLEKEGKAPMKLNDEFIGPWMDKEISHQSNIRALESAGEMISECKA